MVQVFSPAGYELTGAAVTFLVAALLILQFVIFLLIYERRTRPTLAFLATGGLIGVILLANSLALMASSPATARAWMNVSLVADDLGMPVIYTLVVLLTDTFARRRLAVTAIGAVALLFGAGSLAGASWAVQGESASRLAHPNQVFHGLVIMSCLAELGSGIARAQTALERRKLFWVTASLTVGSIALIGYTTRAGMLSPVYMVPLVAAFGLLGFATIRVRALELTPAFAADAILATMDELVLVCDGSGVVRVANGASRQLLGCLPAALIGKSLAGMLADPEAAAAILATRGVAPPRMLQLRCRNGVVVPVSVSVSSLPRRNGSSGGFVLVARDEREQIAARQMLQASEQRYRWLYESAPIALATMDAEGRFLDLNPACARIAATPVEGLVGHRFDELILPADRAEAGQVFRQALGGQPGRFEVSAGAPDGRRRIIAGVMTPVTAADGTPCVLGMAQDVTSTREAQRQVERQKRYFETLLQNSPGAIVLLTTDGRIERVNDEFVRLFGYTVEEVAGRDLDELITRDGERSEAAALTREAARGGRAQAEGVRYRKDGTPVDVAILASSVAFEGEPSQLYAIYTDIRGRKTMEAALSSQHAQMQRAQRLAAVAQLAGGIAHDFNNLLTVMEVRTQMALERIAEPDPVTQDLRDIGQAAQRAAGLVRKLLAVSQQHLMHPVLLDLNDLVSGFEPQLRALLPAGVTLQIDCAPIPACVWVDRAVMEQILTELVRNAAQAMPGVGRVRIGLGLDQAAAARSVRISVTDTGSGMEPGTLARVFEPFFTTRHRASAQGLGLATVYGLVTQSGGEVLVESVPGAGSTFTIVLPGAQTECETQPARVSERTPGQVTVLLVDDEAMVRQVVRRTLERRGFCVHEAADGLEALDLLARLDQPPDLLLTDLVMPRLGGHELAERVRAQLPQVRIATMSGYDQTFADQSTRQSCDVFLAKPFTVDQLLATVQHALSPAPDAVR